jgi:hypothetical protein
MIGWLARVSTDRRARYLASPSTNSKAHTIAYVLTLSLMLNLLNMLDVQGTCVDSSRISSGAARTCSGTAFALTVRSTRRPAIYAVQPICLGNMLLIYIWLGGGNTGSGHGEH